MLTAESRDIGTVIATVGVVIGLVAVGLVMWKYLSPKILTGNLLFSTLRKPALSVYTTFVF